MHINIDRSCFGKVVEPTVKIWGDSADALQVGCVLTVTRKQAKDNEEDCHAAVLGFQ